MYSAVLSVPGAINRYPSRRRSLLFALFGGATAFFLKDFPVHFRAPWSSTATEKMTVQSPAGQQRVHCSQASLQCSPGQLHPTPPALPALHRVASAHKAAAGLSSCVSHKPAPHTTWGNARLLCDSSSLSPIGQLVTFLPQRSRIFKKEQVSGLSGCCKQACITIFQSYWLCNQTIYRKNTINSLQEISTTQGSSYFGR